MYQKGGVYALSVVDEKVGGATEQLGIGRRVEVSRDLCEWIVHLVAEAEVECLGHASPLVIQGHGLLNVACPGFVVRCCLKHIAFGRPLRKK